MPAPSPVRRLPIAPASPQGADLLRERLRAKESDDLVFAVTGYIGSGTSWVAQGLIEKVKEAGFEPYEIKLSELLAEQHGAPRSRDKSIAETTALQDAGYAMRAKHGASMVAGLGIRKIRAIRQMRRDNAPCAFVIDSLKHPAEVDVLRSIYGQSFYLIGVVCNEGTRKKRLKLKFKREVEKGTSVEDKIAALMKRDREDEESLGQRVRKTLHLSDFFVANDNQSESMLGDELGRFLQAVTGQGLVRPRKDEKGIHAAWSAALRSSCLSRQVGASIVSASGQLLSTGTNEPPSPTGGVYTEDSDPDHRCFKSPAPDSGYCRNDRKKKEIYEEIFRKLQRTTIQAGEGEQDAVPLLAPAAALEDLIKVLRSTRIRDLIEFSRAVHAEMDALLAIARGGTQRTIGASLYCTTYPCHSCARHIVAAGIREVVYIEPYDKSLANELHDDAIRDVSVMDSNDPGNDSRVTFRLFGGVAPRRFAALFEKRRDLKNDTDGLRIDLTDRVAHSDPILKGSYLTLEDDVATSVSEVLEGSQPHG